MQKVFILALRGFGEKPLEPVPPRLLRRLFPNASPSAGAADVLGVRVVDLPYLTQIAPVVKHARAIPTGPTGNLERVAGYWRSLRRERYDFPTERLSETPEHHEVT
jgi:hypothetical protein